MFSLSVCLLSPINVTTAKPIGPILSACVKVMVYGLSKLRLEMKKILSEKNCKLSIFRNSTNLNKKKLRKCFFQWSKNSTCKLVT